jgi:hypothetical protein
VAFNPTTTTKEGEDLDVTIVLLCLRLSDSTLLDSGMLWYINYLVRVCWVDYSSARVQRADKVTIRELET